MDPGKAQKPLVLFGHDDCCRSGLDGADRAQASNYRLAGLSGDPASFEELTATASR